MCNADLEIKNKHKFVGHKANFVDFVWPSANLRPVIGHYWLAGVEVRPQNG